MNAPAVRLRQPGSGMRKAQIMFAWWGVAYQGVFRFVGEQMLLGRREEDQLREMLWQQ